MNKRIISVLTVVIMAVVIMAGTAPQAAAAVKTGGLVWKYRDASNSAMTGITAPAIDEESKYIYAASAKQFYKLDAKNGKLKGKVTLSGSVGYNKIAPAIADGKAFVPLGAGKLDIIDTAKMKLLKTVQFADAETHKGHQTLTPAVYDPETDTVYLGSWRRGYGGVYAAVSLEDYSVKIVAESETGFYWSGACTEGDYVIFGSGSDGTNDVNTPSDGDARLYAWKKSDGTLLETVIEDSGSICSSVVSSGGKYYVMGKSGRLYEIEIVSGKLNASELARLTGESTCTPFILDGKAYIGTASTVEVVELATGRVLNKYKAPADVKGVSVAGGRIYCTYNKKPGGIYEVKAGMNFFVPGKSMQQYCISTIAVGKDGTLYYSNDSNNVMAVRAGYTVVLKAPKQPTVKRISATKAKLKWNKVSGAAGYKVYRSAKKNGTYKCMQTVKGLNVTVKAKKGAKYYYKVRAYKGNNLGKMSPAKYYKFK